MAALRDQAKGMTEYATDNEDWIFGSPDGSGSYLKGITDCAWGPALQTWDWMGPMSKQWGYAIIEPSKGDLNGVKKRFNELRSNGAFLCAGNKFIATAFISGFDAAAGWMVSFNTQRLQVSVAAETATGIWDWSGGGGSRYQPPRAQELEAPRGSNRFTF